MSELKRPYPVIVTWVDIVGTNDWTEAHNVTIEPVEQWGILIYRDRDQIKLAHSMMGKKWYGITAIPTGCVKEIRRLSWKG